MRILVIIHEYPPIGGGGGKAAEEISGYLASRGHDVRVITSHVRGLPRTETRDGVQISRIPCRRKEFFRADLTSMMLYEIRGLWDGLSLTRRWKPDVIHAHFAVPSGPPALVISRLTGVPYVLTAHLGDVPGGVPEKTSGWFRWVKPLTPPVWRGASRVTAVSEHTRQLALAHYQVPIEVIPNAVDLEKMDPGEIETNQPPAIAFAGRFQPQKNLHQMVQILGRITDLPWTCLLIGDGPQRAQIEAEISKRGLQQRVALPGWIDPDEVIRRFKGSDILFMPSLSEGLPVVGLQALSMGLAIVASRIGGFVDLVEEGSNGFLLDPEDADGLENALRELLGNRERLLAFRRHSREIARRFDINVVGISYERILTEAARANNKL